MVKRKLSRVVLIPAGVPVSVSVSPPEPITSVRPLFTTDKVPSVATKVSDNDSESESAMLIPANADALPLVKVDAPSAKIIMGSAA